MSNEEKTVGSERLRLVVERIEALRKEQPTERGGDPMETSPDLVRAVADAADHFGIVQIAKATGMGRSTVSEWVERARRAGASAKAELPFGADREIAAIVRCVEVLESLDREGRHRVLNYLDERFFGRSKTR